MNYKDYYLELVRASKNRKLVFFVGAGVSRISGYPAWSDLVSVFYSDLYGSKKDDFSNDENLRIAQIFYDVRGKSAYNQVLKQVFGVKREPNSIHWKMLALNPAHFITTNYDVLIEQACVRRGRNFKVISSDADVAKVDSPGYILKMHGDFKDGYDGDSIVLKESDYLNYESNYPLISNLMKTILATHTVVFIGYGLGDYNVNHILNWVKQLQGEGFTAPFFIRTESNKLREHDITYYYKKGLRIIETAELTDTMEYVERYAKVLDGILEFKENLHLNKDAEIIDYIWHKVAPLFRLVRTRKKDLSLLFEGDYYFESSGAIYRVQDVAPQYMERFFSIQNKDIDYAQNVHLKTKFSEVKEFFGKNDIVGMADVISPFEVKFIYINSLVFHGEFEEMESICNAFSDSPEKQYQKAFYLAYLGRWEEAYNLYSEVISKTVESDHLIYYLSQLNRYWLYLSIRQRSHRFKVVIPGLLTKGFYEQVQREMRNFNVNHLFGEMPYGFREEYPFLETLSNEKFLYDDTVQLFEKITKVQEQINKRSYTFGWSSDLDVEFSTDDTLAFLYENRLWFSSFELIKQYTRNSLLLKFEKANYDLTRDMDEFSDLSGEISIALNYHDFIKITISFTIEDIKFIERNYGSDLFNFNEQPYIESYLIRLAEVFKKHFSDVKTNPVFYELIIDRLKLGLYLTKHLRLSENTFNTLLGLLLYELPERETRFNTYSWLERMAQGSGLYNSSVSIMDEFILECLESQRVSASNSVSLMNYAILIKHFKKNYISENLSNYALGFLDREHITRISNISILLSPDAQKHISDIKGDHIGSIHELMLAEEMGKIGDLADYQEMINEYLAKYMKQVIRDKEAGIITIDFSQDAVCLGICYFLKRLHDPTLRQFVGIIDEYDMFVEPETFDYESKFNPAWLKRYNGGLLEEIAENEYIRPHVLEALKERVLNTNDKQYKEILLNYFL